MSYRYVTDKTMESSSLFTWRKKSEVEKAREEL